MYFASIFHSTLIRRARWYRPTAKPTRGITVAAPYEPGEKSGGSTAIRGLLRTLSRDFEVNCVGLCELPTPLGRFRRRVADLLTLALPMPVHCRAFVLAPGAICGRLAGDQPVLLEFLSGAVFLLGVGPLSARTILRDHEVLVRRLVEEARAAQGLDRVVGLLRIAVAWLLSHDIYCKVDRIITLTPEDAAYLTRAFPITRGRVRFVPVAIDIPDSPAPAHQPAPNEVLFLANFYHRPNVDGLLWFLKEVAPWLAPGRTLHLVGLDATLVDIPLESGYLRIIRHGFVEDLGGRFGNVQVAVAPVISGGGVRMKNLFLASHAKAVITTPRGNEGIGFANGEEALVCESGPEMAAAIEQLLGDPGRARQLGERAREKVVAAFSPDAIRRAYLSEFGEQT